MSLSEWRFLLLTRLQRFAGFLHKASLHIGGQRISQSSREKYRNTPRGERVELDATRA
jgi:hypothetical protein